MPTLCTLLSRIPAGTIEIGEDGQFLDPRQDRERRNAWS
jgi:hypothetical protein